MAPAERKERERPTELVSLCVTQLNPFEVAHLSLDGCLSTLSRSEQQQLDVIPRSMRILLDLEVCVCGSRFEEQCCQPGFRMKWRPTK